MVHQLLKTAAPVTTYFIRKCEREKKKKRNLLKDAHCIIDILLTIARMQQYIYIYQQTPNLIQYFWHIQLLHGTEINDKQRKNARVLLHSPNAIEVVCLGCRQFPDYGYHSGISLS